MRGGGGGKRPPFPVMSRIFTAGTALCLIGLIASVQPVVSNHINVNGETRGPYFVIEPSNHVEFSNETGVSINCTAHGIPEPLVTWVRTDGSLVSTVPSLRRVMADGSLVFPPFNADEYRAEVHTATYKCMASNKLGTVVSRDVNVKAGISQHYEIQVHDVHVIKGNTAVFKCIIPKAMEGFVTVVSWIRNSFLEIQPKSLLDEDKYLILLNGDLHIQSTGPEDDGAVFQCKTRNRLTGSIKTSMTAARLTVIDSLGSMSPKIMDTKDVVRVKQGETAVLPCVTQGIPVPVTTWFGKVHHEQVLPLHVGARLQQTSGALIISDTRLADSSAYICVANNTGGTDRAETALTVTVPLSVKVQPPHTVADVGSSVTFTCEVTGIATSFSWLKNGRPIRVDRVRPVTADTVRIDSVQPEDRGMYQCMARNGLESAQGAAELRLGDSKPDFRETFAEKIEYPGGFVSLPCVATGSPPPHFKWTLDGIVVAEDERVSTSEMSDENGNVVTSLNITDLVVEDGGLYSCHAINRIGSTEHGARLHIYGTPVVRSHLKLSAVAGERSIINCPSYGYPIEKYSWEKDGVSLPDNIRQTVYVNGTLVISEVRKVYDSGRYTCIIRNNDHIARGDVEIVVLVPPRWRIQPKDSSVLLGREVLLNCQADGFPKPKIKWMKAEGGNIIQHRDVIHMSNVHVLSNGSLHIKHSTETHRGQYFCIANNGVGGDLSKAVTVNVNVPVTFHSKYQAQSAILGENTSLVCSAKGETPITLNWTVDQSRSSRHIINETPTRFGRISTLQIMAVEREDSGSYLCAAKNEFGADETTIELTVKESPEPPTNLEVSLRKNQKAFLSWTAPYNGNSPIIRYVVQYKFTSASWNSDVLDATFDAKEASGTIGGLRPATTYNFRVLAENDIGVSQASEVVTVTTEEEAPGGPPQAVNVEALDSQTLKVTWKPPREDLLYGVLRGYQVGHRARGSNDPYAFQILEIPANATPPAELSLNVTELRKYSPYHIVVAAYNNKGRGPLSQEVMVMTAEDIPSKPPQGVRCSTLTSQTIYITWQPPPPNAMNGVLLGYKVFYQPAEDWFDGKPSVKTTSAYKMTVVKLEKFTNYSIQVLAFTKVGDGVKSLPLYCKTHEDVPGSPANIRVLPASGESVLVVWRPPLQTNGIVTRYIVYCKNLDGRDVRVEKLVNEPVIRHSVSANVLQHEVRRLRRNRRYEFWVTAATGAGEGQSSRVITQSPASNKAVPAAVASFDDVVVTNWKENLLLECHTIGAPFPDRRWLIDGHTIVETSRIRIVANGSLSVLDVQGEDEGNYTCRVENDHGHGEVKYQLIIQAPPSLSSFEVLSITMTSITVHWRVKSSGGHPIQGFILNHKRDQETTWERTEISPSQETYTLESLACGTKYHLYLVAVSRVGIGNPAETLTITTEGTIPTIPPKQKLIEENSSFVTLRLDSWIGNGDCPITALSVEYRVKTHYKWAFVTESANLEQKKLVIPGLLPATWYKLRMTANSSAGASTANYDFATLTPSGGTVPPELGLDEDIKGILFYLDLRFIIAIAASLFVILAALITMCICIKKGKASSGKRKEKQINTLHKEETMQSRPNSWTKPPRQDGNADTFSRIHTGNQHIGRYADSPDELAPCATFDLPTQQYRQQMKTFGHGSSIPLGVPGGLIPNTANSTLNLQTFVAPSRPVSDISGKFDTLPNPNNYHHTYTRYSNPAETLSVGYRSPVATSTPSSPRRIHMIDVPTPNGPGMITCNTPPVSKDYEPVIRENGSIPRDGAPPMVPVNKDHLQRTALADEGITRFSGPRSQWKKVIFEDPNHHDETAETTFIFENPLDENEHITTGHGTLSGRDKKPQVQRINKLDDKVNSIGESTRLLAK